MTDSGADDRIANSVLETIGSPLVSLSETGPVEVAGKLEGRNPSGSAKIRPAVAMLRAAEEDGRLAPGGRVVEASSGNTGIGLALACAVLDYELTVVMPAARSPERRALMAAYGATVETVDGEMAAARERADEIAAGDAVRLEQFADAANPRAHYEWTARELLAATGDRRIDALVVAVGTGGTISGVGRRLRERWPDVAIVAVEPAGNAVLSGGPPGDGGFQGMGPGFVAENVDLALIDRIETVAIGPAEAECRRLARKEGILVGQSSGAASLAAKRVARDLAEQLAGENHPPDQRDEPARDERPADPGSKLVVTVFPDDGERYLSAGTFEDEPD